MNPDYGFSDDSSRIAYFDETTPFHWYIRSKIDSSITILLVEDDGEIQQYLFNTSGDAGKHILPVRPAFNMDTSNVLFTSAAQKEKVTGTGETLSSVSDYTGNEWKLTLLDGSAVVLQLTPARQKPRPKWDIQTGVFLLPIPAHRQVITNMFQPFFVIMLEMYFTMAI